MRKILLTTALVLPLAGLAFAQSQAPAPETGAETAMEATADAAEATADTAVEAAEDAADAAEAAAETATENAEAAGELAEAAEAATLEAEMAISDKIAREQAANELRIDWVTGASVTSPDDEAIGEVRDVIVDLESGQVIAAIIGVGGLLGIGEKQIAVPWDQLTINSDAQEVTTELTKQEAEAAPEYVFRKREIAPAPATAEPAASDAAAAPAEGEAAPAH